MLIFVYKAFFLAEATGLDWIRGIDAVTIFVGNGGCILKPKHAMTGLVVLSMSREMVRECLRAY